MLCPKCNQSISDQSNYCCFCGAPQQIGASDDNDTPAYDYRKARKAFSRVGIALTTIAAVVFILQLVLLLLAMSWEPLKNTSWGIWVVTFAPMYLVAFPVGILILKTLPKDVPEQNKLGTANFLSLLPIAFFLTYTGNIIGTVLSSILSRGNSENTLLDFIEGNTAFVVLIMVILAPIMEELIFRKLIIDRTKRYGEKIAVFVSALTFALFHFNLYQFFYAFALGWVFAYVYVRTGRLRYPIILHVIVNFFGSVVSSAILSLVDLDAIANIDINAMLDPSMTSESLLALYGDILPGILVMFLYLIFIFVLSISGLILTIVKAQKLTWKRAEAELPDKKIKTVYLNVGMMLYLIISIILTIASLSA